MSVDLENIVQQALNILEVLIVKDNIMVVLNNYSQKKIEVYDNELMQVVLNILQNAQENFTQKCIEKPRIEIMVYDRRIVIYDNGGGMEVNILEKIFDPYFSTKSEKNGTGLGLYMSKTIVEEHHKGTLHVENRDEGVCFIISL